MPSGPTVGEPATTPPISVDHSCVGALAEAAPARWPVCRVSPPNIANGGEPAGAGIGDVVGDVGVVGDGDGDGDVTERGSTHCVASHTLGARQSVSLPHPVCRACVPLHPVAATATTAAVSRRPFIITCCKLARAYAFGRSFENRSASFSK